MVMFRPFEDLKHLLENRPLPAGPELTVDTPSANEKMEPLAEASLFAEAMNGVKRMSRENCVEKTPSDCLSSGPAVDEEGQALTQLQELVDCGKGFVVANTPEYIEGACDNAHPETTQRLHRGEFSIQAHLDLHGLTVEEAQNAFDRFLKENIHRGNHTVLIIHGRGLSSPIEPVLKTNVYNWLSHGPWRRWVIAFTSARPCDGGVGASYVLLRRKPLPKKQIRQNSDK